MTAATSEKRPLLTSTGYESMYPELNNSDPVPSTSDSVNGKGKFILSSLATPLAVTVTKSSTAAASFIEASGNVALQQHVAVQQATSAVAAMTISEPDTLTAALEEYRNKIFEKATSNVKMMKTQMIFASNVMNGLVYVDEAHKKVVEYAKEKSYSKEHFAVLQWLAWPLAGYIRENIFQEKSYKVFCAKHPSLPTDMAQRILRETALKATDDIRKQAPEWLAQLVKDFTAEEKKQK